MQKIPIKIQKIIEDNPTYNWIDKYDRLYSDKLLEETLKLENQLSFWRINCSIRLAFIEIEKEIQSSRKSSTRLVGWSEIARRAKCDRNTLKRSDRLIWIEEYRTKMLLLIDGHKDDLSNNQKLEIVTTEEQKILNLNQELELSKKEAAKWFVKYEEQAKELDFTKEALNRQMKTNSLLNEEMNVLNKRIKELLSNISTKK